MSICNGWEKPPEGYYLSTEDWIASAGLKPKDFYYTRFKEEKEKFFAAPKTLDGSIHWRFLAEQQCRPKPAFVAVIPGGRVWGSKGSVISPDNKLLWDLSFDYGITPEGHPVFKMKRMPPLKESRETVAVLTFCASKYYYHWMFDVLPRLELLRRKKIEVSKIILNYNGSPFQLETLNALGISPEKIVACHSSFHFRAKRLLAPSLTGGHLGRMPQWACTFLRKNFLPRQADPKYKEFKRLYISRESAGNRRVLNEPQIVGILSNYGFKRVFPEFMPFAEQVQLFMSAEAVVSAHGSGLTNLVFCRPGTKVLEFFSPNYVNVLYWVLSNHVQLEYYYLIGEGELPPAGVDPHMVWEHITVNPEHLAAMLKKMGM